MTRRPASRRPPKLPDPEPQMRRDPDEPRKRTPREQVLRTRVTGTHARLGRTEFLSMVRGLRDGKRALLWGLDPFPGIEREEILEVARSQWGWREHDHKAVISPDRTRAGMLAALGRIDDVAAAGGRIAFATGRPASMLPLYQSLARRARAAGAEVLVEQQSGEIRSDGRSGRWMWWYGDVAVITDGAHLLCQSAVDAVDEWLFWLPRPQLVVADTGFAGGAVRDGLETVAFADLDAVALGVAGARGKPVTVVPVDVQRAPYGYELLLAWAEAPLPTSRPLEEAASGEAAAFDALDALDGGSGTLGGDTSA